MGGGRALCARPGPRAVRRKGAGAKGHGLRGRGGPAGGAFKLWGPPARGACPALHPPLLRLRFGYRRARCGLPWRRASGSSAPSPGTAGERAYGVGGAGPGRPPAPSGSADPSRAAGSPSVLASGGWGGGVARRRVLAGSGRSSGRWVARTRQLAPPPQAPSLGGCPGESRPMPVRMRTSRHAHPRTRPRGDLQSVSFIAEHPREPGLQAREPRSGRGGVAEKVAIGVVEWFFRSLLALG